jgi:hypothetical protein
MRGFYRRHSSENHYLQYVSGVLCLATDRFLVLHFFVSMAKALASVQQSVGRRWSVTFYLKNSHRTRNSLLIINFYKGLIRKFLNFLFWQKRGDFWFYLLFPLFRWFRRDYVSPALYVAHIAISDTSRKHMDLILRQESTRFCAEKACKKSLLLILIRHHDATIARDASGRKQWI